MGLSSLQSRHIVLSGVSRGVGNRLAHGLLSAGARVSVCARSADALVDFHALDQANAHALDITERAAVDHWITTGVQAFGPIDAVINNAAILGSMQPIAEYKPDDWAAVMAVNVTGTFQVTQATLPHVVRPGGIYLHVSSYLGRHGLERYGAYSASKFGVEGLAQVLAEEHRAEGIISCAIDPGMIQTDMLRAAMGTDDVSDHHSVDDATNAFMNVLKTITMDDSGKPINLWTE